MLQREIRLKEVQDATYDDMCRLLNERKLCNVERCTGMGKTTIFLRYIREHPDETVLYFYDTDDIKNKIKTETDGKDVLLMSYQKLFRTADPLPMYDFLKSQVVNQYHLLRPMLEDTSKIDALWSEVPPSIRDNYTGDREVLLRELGLLE